MPKMIGTPVSNEFINTEIKNVLFQRYLILNPSIFI